MLLLTLFLFLYYPFYVVFLSIFHSVNFFYNHLFPSLLSFRRNDKKRRFIKSYEGQTILERDDRLRHEVSRYIRMRNILPRNPLSCHIYPFSSKPPLFQTLKSEGVKTDWLIERAGSCCANLPSGLMTSKFSISHPAFYPGAKTENFSCFFFFIYFHFSFIFTFSLSYILSLSLSVLVYRFFRTFFFLSFFSLFSSFSFLLLILFRRFYRFLVFFFHILFSFTFKIYLSLFF